MNRLVVNPGTPQAWEIQLKPGTNSIGRGDANDFQINDPSVSGSHCTIAVNDHSVVLTDLGSTNGTFAGAARVQELKLDHGREIRLGSAAMIFYAGEGAPATVAQMPPLPPPVRMAVRAVTPPVAAPAPAQVVAAAPVAALTGARFCKYHPQLPARFLCRKCDRTYCDLCIQTSDVGGGTVQTCRTCGTELAPFQFAQAPARGFYAKLPVAFLYPFKGAGVIILVCATIAFAALGFISAGILGIFVRIALYGFVFLFMQNIILTTTSNEAEALSFPEVSSLFGAAFQLFGTVVASFWLAIGLAIAKYKEVDIPSEAILGSVILGGIYFPMALLVVAMKESVMAANPLIVIPSMLKVPAKYAVTVVLLLGVFGVRQLGNLISSGAGTVALRGDSEHTFVTAMIVQAGLALLSVYLLTVTMRILGLFYNASKQKLGWFSR